jgi:hypothetical protein
MADRLCTLVLCGSLAPHLCATSPKLSATWRSERPSPSTLPSLVVPLSPSVSPLYLSTSLLPWLSKTTTSSLAELLPHRCSYPPHPSLRSRAATALAAHGRAGPVAAATHTGADARPAVGHRGQAAAGCSRPSLGPRLAMAWSGLARLSRCHRRPAGRILAGLLHPRPCSTCKDEEEGVNCK